MVSLQQDARERHYDKEAPFAPPSDAPESSTPSPISGIKKNEGVPVRNGSRKRRRPNGSSSRKSACKRVSGSKSAGKKSSEMVLSSSNGSQDLENLKTIVLGHLECEQSLKESSVIAQRHAVQGIQEQWNGELESGEIEIDLSAPDSTMSNSDMADDNLLSEKGLVARGNARGMGSHSKTNRGIHGSSDVGEDDKNSRHSDRDMRFFNRKLNECMNLVTCVTIDEAQRSFVTICRNLRNALIILSDLNEKLNLQDGALEVFAQKFSKALSKTFDGIQAAYTAQSKWAYKEQDDEDSGAFLRLLELARSSQKLLSSKQVHEIENIMQRMRLYATVDSPSSHQQMSGMPSSSGITEENVDASNSKLNEENAKDCASKMNNGPHQHMQFSSGILGKENLDVRGLNSNDGLKDFAPKLEALDSMDLFWPGSGAGLQESLSAAPSPTFQEVLLPAPTPKENDDTREKSPKVLTSNSYLQKYGQEKVTFPSSPSRVSSFASAVQTDSCKFQETVGSSELVRNDPAGLESSSTEEPQCQAMSTDSVSVETKGTDLMETEAWKTCTEIKRDLKMRDPRKVLREAQPQDSPSRVECGSSSEDLSCSVSDKVNQVKCEDQQDVLLKQEVFVKDTLDEISQDESASRINTDRGICLESSKHEEAPCKDPVIMDIDGKNVTNSSFDVPHTSFEMNRAESSSQNASMRLSRISIAKTAVDLKPKMKLRDPRRALLEGTQRTGGNLGEGDNSQGSNPTEGNKGLETEKVTTEVGNTLPSEHNVSSISKQKAIIERDGFESNATCATKAHDCNSKNDCPQVLDDLRLRGSKCSLQSGKIVGNVVATKAPPKSSAKNIGNSFATFPEGPKCWEDLDAYEGLDEKQRGAIFEERARRLDEQNRMLNSRKLCLVLDLDHTLLNSAKFVEVGPDWEAVLLATEASERNKVAKEGSSRRQLYRFQHMGMWTKLRPGVWNFLSKASQLYELHVYTMGNKAYATEMARLLDPTGSLFAGRVISKGADGDVMLDERPSKIKDLDGVLGMESAVMIIDDSLRVWPHHRHNLVVVERYMYFPSSRRQFGLSGPSLLEIRHDEREVDGMLASVLQVIEKVHERFFSNKWLHEVDVRRILAGVKQNVLAGCKIVFSRVFPQGELHPHLHPLWQTAEHFGAICTTNIDEGITHVVGTSRGTDKVKWAMSTGRHSVSPAWLEASAALYRRVNEHEFPVPP